MRGPLKSNQQHINWRQLQDYLQGRLSSAEMHELENHLQNCQLCREAMEGLEKTSEAKAQQDLKELKLQLQAKISNDTPSALMLFPYWKVAAALIVLVVGYFALVEFSVFKKEPLPSVISENLIQSKDQPGENNIEKPETAITPETNQAMPSNAQEEEEVKTPAPAAKKEPQHLTTNPLSEGKIQNDEPKPAERLDDKNLREEKALAASEIETDLTIEKVDNIAEGVKISKNSQKSAPPTIALSEKRALPEQEETKQAPVGNEIKGKVISSEDGEPLPGVNVLEKNSQNGTVTDMNGNFSLTLSNRDRNLVFSAVGFTTEEVNIRQQNSVVIEMQTDVAALTEVVVVGYGQQSRKDYSSFRPAQPSVGNREFKNYIKENLRYPQEARENNIEGVVVLRFQVSQQGEIRNIEIKKSLGHGCDEEAIRLLRQGPTWQPAKQEGKSIEQTKKLRIKFKLPN